MATRDSVYNNTGQPIPTGASASTDSANFQPTGPQYGMTDQGLMFLQGNSDSYINAVNQGAQWMREDALRKEANEWDSRSLDRLFQAAERNGINPVLLLDAFNSSGTSASYTTSAAKANSYDSNAKTEAANSAKIIGSILAALAIVAAHAL